MASARNAIFALCLWTLGLAPAGQAGTVYRWIDEQGDTHFSDSEPDKRASTAIELQPTTPQSSTGLRPGERATLHSIEKRQQSRHQTATRARHEQRRKREARRRICSDNREQLRRGHRHVDSKAVLKYQREHCW